MRLIDAMQSPFVFRVRPLLIAAAVIVAIAFPGFNAFGEEDKSVRPSTPPWQLAALGGERVKSSDFDGKVVILNFWATWCVPCREEIPGLVELQKQYGDKGVVVVGLSLDQGGPELVKRFVERFKINYPVVMADEKIVKEFGSVEAVPTTFIIDREGRIAGKHIGFAEKAVFEREIKSLL